MIAASLMLGGALAIFVANRSTGGAIAAAASHMLRDPLDIFDMRSPGEREAGVLTQTKARKLAGDRPGPHERVLSVVRERPPFLTLPLIPQDIVNPLAQQPLAFGTPTPQGIADPRYFVPSTSGPPAAGGPNQPQSIPFSDRIIRPESIDNSSEPDTPGGPGDNESVPLSPIPEPATWAMLITGFLAIGVTMRRARQAALNAQPGGES